MYICVPKTEDNNLKLSNPFQYVQEYFDTLIKNLNVETDLDHYWLYKTYFANEGLCAYCKNRLYEIHLKRMYEDIGFVQGNVVLVCNICNYIPIQPDQNSVKLPISENVINDRLDILVKRYKEVTLNIKEKTILLQDLNEKVVTLKKEKNMLTHECNMGNQTLSKLKFVIAQTNEAVRVNKETLVNLDKEYNNLSQEINTLRYQHNELQKLYNITKDEYELLILAHQNLEANKEEVKEYHNLATKCKRLRSILAKYDLRLTEEDIELINSTSSWWF